VGPDDDGFDELFDVLFPVPPTSGLPAERWKRARIETSDSSDRKIRFVFERVDTPANFLDREAPTMRTRAVKSIVDAHVQEWFTKRAVALLAAGFSLQIVSSLLSIVSQ
jgi:hypothetical protein